MELQTPIHKNTVASLRIGDRIELSGWILCGRDAVLPKLVKLAEDGLLEELGIDLMGSVIFHTAVSPAGVGPTSSNKLEIENSILPLSRAGVRVHLGKGLLRPETIQDMAAVGAVYAVIPPVTALLGKKTITQEVAAFPELGMEALYRLKVDRYPAIIAAAQGRSIYE